MGYLVAKWLDCMGRFWRKQVCASSQTTEEIYTSVTNAKTAGAIQKDAPKTNVCSFCLPVLMQVLPRLLHLIFYLTASFSSRDGTPCSLSCVHVCVWLFKSNLPPGGFECTVPACGQVLMFQFHCLWLPNPQLYFPKIVFRSRPFSAGGVCVFLTEYLCKQVFLGCPDEYLIILDLEATCDYSPNPVVDRETAEIIEWSWVPAPLELLCLLCLVGTIRHSPADMNSWISRPPRFEVWLIHVCR